MAKKGRKGRMPSACRMGKFCRISRKGCMPRMGRILRSLGKLRMLGMGREQRDAVALQLC
jgi:hypothetical protein